MKSVIFFAALANQLVSGLPLGSLLNGDLTNALLGSAVGGIAVPGLLEGDIVTPLLDGVNVVGNSGDILSPVEDLLDGALDISDLGLDKRSSTHATDLAIVDALLKGAVSARLGYPVLGAAHIKRDAVNALISRGIATILPHAKRYVFPNGATGEVGTGLIELAGHLNHIGSAVVAVDGVGASGNIKRDSYGQIGTGVISAAGILNHVGAGGILVDGLGAAGHIDGGLDSFDGQLGTGIIGAAGTLNHIGGGAVAVGGIGASGHIDH